MKKLFASVLMTLLLGNWLLPPLCADASETVNLNVDNKDTKENSAFDGFLIGMPDGWDIQLFSKGSSWLREIVPEPVIDGIYWVESLQVVQELKKLGVIEFFEPNYYATLFDDSGDNSNGWPYEVLTAAYAGSYGLNGSGIRIGIIDSGVDPNNPDLQNAKLLQGHNYIQDSTDTSDDVYHGTKVTQVICGDHNGLGLGGIAADSEIVPLKCFSALGEGTVKILAEAIAAAANDYQCDIINMSWGLGNNSKTLYDALQKAYEAGVTLVAAAGNVTSSYPQGSKIYPAAYPEVISVSAVNSSLEVLSSSQRNDQVFVCAPGGGVPFVDEGGNITYDSGTSFACPFVTAEIAVLQELDPALDRETIRNLMVERAVDLGDSGYDTAYGHGLLPLDKLIGQHWSRFYTVESDGQSKCGVSGWTLNHGGSRALFAAYDGSGKMMEFHILATELDIGFYDYVFTEKKVGKYMVAYTDKSYIPLSFCEIYSP